MSRGGVALNAFARVAAEMEGRHSARAPLTSEREFPRLGDIYVQSITICDLLVAKPGFFFVDHTTGMSVI